MNLLSLVPSPWGEIAVAGGVAIAAAGGFYVGSQHEHKTHVIREAVMESAFDKTVGDVRLKTAQAAAADLDNARKNDAAQSAANEESFRDYETNLAALRAHYDGLRRTSAANSGGSGKPSLPATGPVAAELDDTPKGDGLFGYAQAADENTLKLIELQKAVKARDDAFNARVAP